MSIQDDDINPRPLPKPAQIEMVSVQSEVPEPSLIIDKSLSRSKYMSLNGCNPKFQQQPNNSNPQRTGSFNHNFDNIPVSYLGNSPEPLSSSSSYLPSVVHKQTDLHPFSRKVSFSPLSNDAELMKSANPMQNAPDHCKYLKNSEIHNCKCSNYATELTLRNDSKFHSSPVCTDFTRKMQRVPFDYEHTISNEMCSRKRCSCADCLKEYFNGTCNFVMKEQKSNFISVEELQKTVLKFENLFLKLNYKYSKITENFVSKEEFNAVTRSYEARIHSMQELIDTVVAKNKTYRCNYCCQTSVQYGSRETSENSADLRSASAPVEETEIVKSCRNDTNKHNFISDNRVSANVGVSSTNKYEDKQTDRPPFQHELLHCQKTARDHSNYLPSPTDELDKSRKNDHGYALFDERNKLISENRTNNAGNNQVQLDVMVEENKTKFAQDLRNQEYERQALVRNLNDKQQLKLMCNNIAMQVKNMLDQNPPVNINGNADSMKLIREATIEQFHKMGLNVQNIPDEDNLKQSLRENVETHRNLVPKMNTVPSSDLSLHMNALAMKYISNNHKDESEFEKKTVNDVSINCNNVSIATLRYLERHQILSELDKPMSFNTQDYVSSTHRFKSSESNQNNDRSFIR